METYTGNYGFVQLYNLVMLIVCNSLIYAFISFTITVGSATTIVGSNDLPDTAWICYTSHDVY